MTQTRGAVTLTSALSPRIDSRTFLAYNNGTNDWVRDLAGSLNPTTKIITTSTAEFIDQQKVVHRIAPAHAREEAEIAAGQGCQTALRFHLAEANVLGRDHDVASQHHLDPMVYVMPCTAATIGLRHVLVSWKAST